MAGLNQKTYNIINYSTPYFFLKKIIILKISLFLHDILMKRGLGVLVDCYISTIGFCY